MVAVIHFSRGFHRVMNYNENKVKEQAAVCLDAANYPKNADDLTFSQKLARLENQAALNENTKVNGVHISLNFDPSEKFSDDKLKEISAVYMDKIGFREQPYLLYRHDDSGHPHVHIVTTSIRDSGKRIELHNLGKVQSEKARKEIEITYGLLKPEDSAGRQKYEVSPVNVQKVQYGKAATKRSITVVLNKVLKDYKYTSLAELNAVLKQYNVMADRGNTTSRIYKNHGLTYKILDADGNSAGVPVKASDIYNKPTLKYLEDRFTANEPLRQPHKTRVKNAVDWAILKNERPSLQSLIQALNKEGINTVIRKNDDGIIYGITYIDHRTQCVFNGSDLGKTYSANAIQERCGGRPAVGKVPGILPDKSFQKDTGAAGNNAPLLPAGNSLIEALLQEESTKDDLPFELKSTRKKKRKRFSNNQ